MPVPITLLNQVFTHLTVIAKADNNGRQTRWLCRCVCGKDKVVETRNLRFSLVKSCGCMSNKMRSLNNKAATHRESKSRTYRTWKMMKQRCDNPNYDKYSYYGGRGITYDPRWSDYMAFKEDMGERPANMSLDRIECEKNYCKENCRWATHETQIRNRRIVVKFTHRGITKSLMDWAAEFGLTRHRLYQCMYKNQYKELSECLDHLNVPY